jgi:Cys-tRNA(Pro)/Cys-tRNA(Cys) deacylase
VSGKVATNGTRVLDARGAAYEVLVFAPEDFTAEEVSAKLGVPPDDVFKTLVARGDRTGPLAAVIPGPARLSLKKLARVSGNRTVSMIPVEEMERLTGYVKGGCSPFGMRKALPLYVHESAVGRARLVCSAGRRGVQVALTGDGFVAASGAKSADLIED